MGEKTVLLRRGGWCGAVSVAAHSATIKETIACSSIFPFAVTLLLLLLRWRSPLYNYF